MVKKDKFYYKNKRIQDLTNKELQACSNLYSKNYGIYSNDSPINPGERVKMSAEYYRKHYFKNNYYVALAYKNSALVGQALYVRKKFKRHKYMTWILQLVVKESERGKHIAKKLMQSIWGFSNDYAWGLVTPNINTIKTLESTTFRKCDPNIIKTHLSEIKQLAEDIDFVDINNFQVNSQQSVINTEFFVNRELDPHIDYKDKWLLGDLPNGYEWLAFTFNQQPIDLRKYKKRVNELLEFSEDALKDAYSRMRIRYHKWAKDPKSEIDFVLNNINMNTNAQIIDLGCGIARHSIELAQRNFNVVGVDFSERHIEYARRIRKKKQLKNIKLYNSDVRTFSSKKDFDLALCLYDVVGSFPDEKDNISIIENAYRLLKSGGYFVLSVMNYELTCNIVPVKQKDDLLRHPEIIIKLPPSRDMMKTGEIFNPKHIAIDTKTNLVFRKEQFPASRSNFLPAEYIIRDKRYSMQEITQLIEVQGFNIIEKRYVQAGKFSVPLESTDPKAKEILIICQKL